MTTEEGRILKRPESDLLNMFRQEILPPTNGAAFPDGVKFVDRRPPFLMVVHQLPPHVRSLRWIARDSPVEYGPGTKYRPVRLSIPYAITFALYFERANRLYLAGANELYFRNEPLRCHSDRLGYPALLNISRIDHGKRLRSWICTQHLQISPDMDWTQQLDALLGHTWNGGFNRSSEDHEGSSWYGESKDIHKDLHPIEQWENATKANEVFALGVPWKQARLTVGELIDCMLEEHGASNPRMRRSASKTLAGGIVQRFINFVQNENAKGKE
ncbi:MAG: hypothetical protein ACC645_11855 [Pirellulales bacterium]